MDQVGFFLVAVLAENVVVEVLALRAHATDVQRRHEATCIANLAGHFLVVGDAEAAASGHLEWTERGVTFGLSSFKIGAPNLVGPLGKEVHRQPAVGEFGGEFHILGTERCQVDRDVFAERMVDQLERLAEPRALILGQRELVVGAVVHDDLSLPDLAADLHDLPLTSEGPVVLDAMEPLNHLRTRRTQPKDEPAARHRIETRGRHGDRAGRAAVDVEDA